MFQNDVTVSNTTISGLQITTAGTYAASDLTNLKAWYSSDNIFSPVSDVLLSTKTLSLGAGLQVFPSWTNQTINSGSTGYIFITADFPCNATAGNTINVNSVVPADVLFPGSIISGTTFPGGTQTVQLATPSNLITYSASIAEASSVLTWTAPTGCYSQVMAVVKEASSITGTPSGDGSAYTGNLTFGNGTGFDGGFVVYQGTASPQTVAGLTNGTAYFVKFFTRNGTNWSPGVETSVTPALQSQANDYYRSLTTGPWASPSTWESSHDNSTWFTATLAPSSTANIITIRNGHTVTVAAAANADQCTIDAGGQVNVSSGQIWTISNGSVPGLTVNGSIVNSGTVTTTGTVVFNSGSSYEHALNGGTVPTATWNAGSICLISGTSSTAPGGLGQAFANFTWNSANTSSATLTSTSIAGNLTISNGGSSQFRLQPSTNPMLIGGNLLISGAANVALASSGTGRTVTVTGNFSLSAGTLDLSSSTGSGTLNVNGDFSISGGTLSRSGSGTANVFFGKNGTQVYSKTGGTIAAQIINFTVNNGSILDMGTSVIDGSSGTFTLNSGAGIITANTSGLSGSIQVGGTKTYSAGANYTYNGTTAQVTGNGLTGASNLTINNGSGVSLSGPVTIGATGSLNLTNGTLTTTGANLLTISNTSNSAITGASSSNFINGPLRVTLPSSMSSGPTYTFPIGKGSTYLPFDLVTPTTGTGAVTAQVEAFTAAAGGTSNGTLNTMSSTEYWSLISVGNFTSSSVSLTRPDPITPFNVVGGSQTLTGAYATLGGTASTNSVSNSNLIGLSRFFLFAEEASAVINLSSPSQVTDGNVQKGINNVILSAFQANVPAVPVTLNSLTFTSEGSYSGSDIDNFILHYNSTPTFAGSSVISTLSTSLGSGTHTFTGLTQTH